MKTILFLIIISLSAPQIDSLETWTLAKDKKGIKVYVNEILNSDYYAFKAIMSVKATEMEIVKILKEVNKYPEWFAFTASAKLLSRRTNEQDFFMETDYPWPFANECMYYNMKFIKTQEGKQKITISRINKSTNCKYSLRKAEGYILLEPNKGATKISYYLHCEPSQNIPTWLINPNIHEMPYQTFIALREKLNVLKR